MRTIAPYSPLGYLCAGEIDLHRGHYASAIKTFDDGLKRSTTSHPHYERLVKAREAAYNESIKHVDFISKLPLDVVIHNIIPRILQGQTIFHIGKPCFYFDICRTWRQRMALASRLQYVLGPDDLSEDDYERVQDLAPFMRSLIVEQPNKEILSKITKKRRIRLTMLKKLRIVESLGRGPSLLLSSLRLLNDTLTDLRIEYAHCKEPRKRYRLCDVLEACPNLSAIRMDDADVDMSSVTKTYPKLIKLELVNTQSFVMQYKVLSLLRPFPKLRVLKLCNHHGSDILSVVDQHCPLLQQLILTEWSPPFFDILDTPDRTGLRALSVTISQDGFDFKGENLVQYLLQHSETLEAFCAVTRVGLDKPKRLLEHAAGHQVIFKRLRRIDYPSDADESLVSFLLWMIQRSPHLESVETVVGSQQAPIMQELIQPQHSNVKRLGMQTSRSTLEDEKQLIQHHLDLGQQSNLRDLKILPGQFRIHDSWLALVPRLTQLVTLELCTPPFMKGFRSLHPLMQVLADGCPALKQLIVMSYNYTIYLHDLYPMGCHGNLKHVVINCSDIRGDVPTFCQRFQNIESLHLSVFKYSLEDIDSLEKGSFKFMFTQKPSVVSYLSSRPLR